MKFLPDSSFLKRHLFCLLFTIPLLISESKAATVTSNNLTTQLNFGRVGPGSSIGSIGNTTSTCSPVTGGVVLFNGCTRGLVSITSKNAGSNVSVANGKKKFRIHIPSTVTTITTNDTTLRFGTVTGCVAAASPAPPSGYIAIDCTNTSNTNNANQTWSIPIIGSLSNISPTQNSQTYTPSYSVIACGCNNGCPNSLTHNKCTGNPGKTLATSLSVQLYKTLSVVESSSLKFGTIVAGSTTGTINQSGATTGGVIAISGSSRSPGAFSVNGEPSAGIPYNLSLPSNVSLSCDSGITPSCSAAPSMLANLSFSSGSGTRVLNSSGSDLVTINGTLMVGANQLVGNYKGIYSVFVNY